MAGYPPSKNFSSMATFVITAILFCNAVFAKPAPILDEVSTYAFNLNHLTADDATDRDKVLAWIEQNVDLEVDKAVFYSDPSVGRPMAGNFCSENEEDGYKDFWLVFNDEFSAAFGGADPGNSKPIARACSQAFAQFAKGETRIFNDAGAGPSSYWKTIEHPSLNENSAVTKIWRMADDTTDPDDHDMDLKNADDGELGYVPGMCGVHVVQYQKNEPRVNPNPDYKFDITIYDNDHYQIGEVLFVDAPNAVGVNVDSQLPDVLIVTAGAVDSDPVSFAYAGNIWDSAGDWCDAAAYNRGMRQIDCDFPCSAPGELEDDI